MTGPRITPEEAYRWIHARGRELLTLMQRASAVRDEAWGRVVTYSRKVFIPLTNLCRDKCAYCTFARPPGDPLAKTLTPDEVLAIARAGQRAGCKEALFSLGERPELVHAAAREALQRLGHDTTVGYLAAMTRLVFEETGLLPHPNPGALFEEELRMLRPWAGSMGMMLENVSERLMEPGQAHFGCPDKAPQRRLATLEAAGRLRIPFTTGILIGIGETREERVDSLFAIAELHARYGHIQEVIIQNFRRKPDIRFRGRDEPSALEMARTLAVARLILPPEISLQAPPNLTPDAYSLYLLAGINDWGGISPVTRDHINPEAPWPAIRELAAVTADAGFELRERLSVYPRFIHPRWLPPEVLARAQALQSALDDAPAG
jgi:FO synthase